MNRRVFRTDKVVDFPAFSQAIVAGGFIFLSGQCAIGIEAGISDIRQHKLDNIPVKKLSFREQTEMVLTNIQTILEAAGTSMNNVVRCNVYLTDMDDYDEMCIVYSSFFPKNPPARCTVEVTRLVKDLLVEIEVTAWMPEKRARIRPSRPVFT